MNILEVRKELLQGKSIYDIPLRVVNYDRVSTDKIEQKNSLKNQANYFQDFIEKSPNWEHVGRYEDEGISGTNVKHREGFLQMIEDAKKGLFDMILTKEISRFARNTIDSIQYTQLLLEYGVVVYFLSDNINTIYSDSEFRLTIMASMAQDEVRKLSERVKFGIHRGIEEGKVGGSSLYGYSKKDGKLTIIPEEAEVVLKIFIWYRINPSFVFLRKKLKEEGILTRNGKLFSDTTLRKMLLNPRYKGWYTAQMSEVIDYKSHKRLRKNPNDWICYPDQSGKIPPIVSEELWDYVSFLYTQKKRRTSEKYSSPYSSRLICQKHHKFLIHSASGKRKKRPVWVCDCYLRKGKSGCHLPILSERLLDSIVSFVIIDIFSISSFIEEMLSFYSDSSLKKEIQKIITPSFLFSYLMDQVEISLDEDLIFIFTFGKKQKKYSIHLLGKDSFEMV